MTTAKRADTICFEDVSRVVVYKLDALTTDLICCDIITGSAGAEQVRTVHEEIYGFEALMLRLEKLPGFDRKWREKVILPPFAENRTIAFQRSSAAA
ncbi:hypothetical protein CLG96_05800 [Sphingomonas oleivorans]|uniref:Uncharacterized protein n=1 Tax=Sphingomonas oleivorans TaxID=1735121 RepID=A0A2T5G0F6_9SPHN|nr:hypothetical protein CLG96_05800 [Sphingomonas oleivorans]